MKSQKIFSYIPLLCLAGLSLLSVAAQNTPIRLPPIAPDTATPDAAPARVHPLAWNAMENVYHAKIGETNASFSFWVTNISKGPVLISRVNPSCGCTVAEYPQPWNLAPGESGEIKANMGIAGKTGTQAKIMTVFSTGGPSQVLTLKALIPKDDNEERRQQNMAAAAKDRQVVFRGDCASCHVEPLVGKMGKDLFDAGCNICHDPPTGAHRAEIVPDLTKLAFPTNKDYWKKIIADGKEGTLMPGFAKAHGGPLTDEEIESLAEYAVKAFPFDPANLPKTR
ncbi:MAG: DUF1573 domain-containing protein [Verrucomicrobia bacterium]|nr:DUF1573 domain-containing protein [Verrucomicrobiota bacterium]